MKVKVVISDKEMKETWPGRWAADNSIAIINSIMISSRSYSSDYIFEYDIPNEEEAMMFRLRWT